MFPSKKKTSFRRKIRNFIWPNIGLKRYFRYLFYRIIRIKDTTYSIACGIACGIAISFTPLWGFHILLAVMFAFLLKGNIIASVIGTIFGNPLTFAAIIPINIFIGRLFMSVSQEYETEISPSNISIDTNFISNLVGCFTDKLSDSFVCVTVAPLFVGGLILMVIFWIVAFSVFWFLISSIKKIKVKITRRQSDK